MNSSVASNFEVVFSIRYSFSIVCVLGRVRRHDQGSQQPNIPCNFQLVSRTKEEEEAFDYVQERGVDNDRTNNLLGSVAHLVKGTLGAGLLGSHVAYMKAGLAGAIPITILVGLGIGYCMNLLVYSAHILYKRTTIPVMTYADVGEAAVCCFPHPTVRRFSKVLRYYIDAVLSMTLFGACSCYQLIIAKTLKQLVEHSLYEEGKEYFELRIYLLMMMIPIIMICLIRHLKYLAPFSIIANIIVVCCMGMAIYYAATLNPKFENLDTTINLSNFFEFSGMIAFSMSCATMVMPVENNMRDPRRFRLALSLAMLTIMFCTFTMAFFGYSAFLDHCDAPITVNFPMDIAPKIVKGLVAFMLFVTHALSFWVLFNICWVYIKDHHNQQRLIIWEYFYRVLCVMLVAVLAITFPNIQTLMGFIGALCISNLAFILPNIIYLLVIWHRPGLGKYKWKLWKTIILMAIGAFCCLFGTVINGKELIKVLITGS